MSVALPALPNLAEVHPRFQDNSAVLTPALGGPVQQIARLGSRFAVDIVLPALTVDQARPWIAARLKARTEAQTLTLEWPQAGPAEAVGGDPVVNGAGQAGARLNVSGLPSGAVVPAQTFFSFSSGGRSYLHATTADATANGAGEVQLHIAPMLRASPADETALEFAAPVIEGFIDGSSVDWNLERLLWTTTAFTLTENE